MALTAPRYMLLLAAAVAATLAGCHTGVCTNNQNSIPCAQFMSARDDTRISVSDLSIGGVGAPHDSLLYKAGEVLSTVYLPLRANDSSTSYRFHFTYDDTVDEETGEVITDTSGDDIITFSYTATPYFDGEDCGAMYLFYITSVDYTTHYIDRIVVDDPYITNTDAVRISIYFRVADEEETPDEGDGEQEGEQEKGGES